jgi:hypothetical protein
VGSSRCSRAASLNVRLHTLPLARGRLPACWLTCWTNTRRSDQPRRQQRRPQSLQSLTIPHRKQGRSSAQCARRCPCSSELLVSPHNPHAQRESNVERLPVVAIRLSGAAAFAACTYVVLNSTRQGRCADSCRTAVHIQGQSVLRGERLGVGRHYSRRYGSHFSCSVPHVRLVSHPQLHPVTGRPFQSRSFSTMARPSV